MLGFSAFMDLRGGVGAVQGIFWFACGTLLGWPFAGALILPFLLEHVMVAVSTGNMYTSIKTLFKGGTRCLMLLASSVISSETHV
jgi:alpha-1,2-mannosyltransferase